MPPDSADAAPWQREFLSSHRLDSGYLHSAARFFDPLAARLAALADDARPQLVALNGSQGSGKSTLCDYLVKALAQEHGVTAIAMSLDDFYLTREQRQTLAAEVHPLLATRGVPGTHDIPLLRGTLEQLLDPQPSAPRCPVPAFDKSVDDRAPARDWPVVELPLQLVLLEGWCLGAHAESDEALREPMNELERDEDPQGQWRAYSNSSLARDYEPFYRAVDFWVMLAAPSFDQVLGWRSEQEQKLARKVNQEGSGLMDEAALRHFVAHFERYTSQCLRDLPASADVLLQLDGERRIVSTRGLEPQP